MLSTLKLSYRIWAGFAAVLLISAALGAVAYLTMKNVERDTSHLATEFVPSVAVANNVERASLSTMYAMRGFTLSEDEKYLKDALEHLAEVQKYLGEATELGNKSNNLHTLKDNTSKATTLVQEYKNLADESIANLKAKKSLVHDMNSAAGVAQANIESYMDDQGKKMSHEIKGGASKDQLSERFHKFSLMNDIADRMNAIIIASLRSDAERDYSYLRNSMKKFDEMITLIGEVKSITSQQINMDQLALIEKNLTSYRELATKVMNNFEELLVINKKRGAAADNVVEAAKVAAQSGITDTQTIANRAMSSLNLAGLVLFGGVIITIILGFGIAFFVTRSIARPIIAVSQTLQNASHEVSSATEQLTTASQKLSEASNESAASLAETSSSMEEFSSMVKRNGSNAQEVNKLAQASKRSAETGDEEIRALILAMGGIVTGSKKIEEIIGVIDDIAFQTNLLALNAAVEAARAGDHGKGFAVVADAVRDLAQRSSTAAKEINTIIKESVQQSDQGAKIAAKSGESLKEIVIGAKKVADLIGEIASASEEQTQGIGQISQAIAQIDQATQSNASISDEAAATSEQLSAQSAQLQQSVEQLLVLVNGRGAQQTAVNHHQPPTVSSHFKGPERPVRAKPHGQKKSEGVALVRTDASKVIPFSGDGDDKDEQKLKLDAASGF